jgi:hypothetical protein
VKERRELCPRRQSSRCQYSRANNPLSTCTWVYKCHCSRIQALLRLHGRSVSIAINDLHPFGLREDEVNHLGSSPSLWFSMATDNSQPYVQQAVVRSWRVRYCIAVCCEIIDGSQEHM